MPRPSRLGSGDSKDRLHRDRSGVSRDIKALELIGLVRTHLEPNPGHGRHKVVESAKRQGERVILQTEV